MKEAIDTAFATALLLWVGAAVAFFAASGYILMVFSIGAMFVTFVAFMLSLINCYNKGRR